MKIRTVKSFTVQGRAQLKRDISKSREFKGKTKKRESNRVWDNGELG